MSFMSVAPLEFALTDAAYKTDSDVLAKILTTDSILSLSSPLHGPTAVHVLAAELQEDGSWNVKLASRSAAKSPRAVARPLEREAAVLIRKVDFDKPVEIVADALPAACGAGEASASVVGTPSVAPADARLSVGLPVRVKLRGGIFAVGFVHSKSRLVNTSLGDAYDVVFEDGHILKDVATTDMRSVEYLEDATYKLDLFKAFRAGLQRSVTIHRVMKPFEKGDEVEAIWGGREGGEQYWIAHITAVRAGGAGGGRYQVTYLDKQTELLAADCIRLHAPKRTLALLPRLEKKTKIATRWIGGNFWESTITAVHASAATGETKYDVLYTDGTPERGVPRSSIRELRCEARDLLGSIVRVGWSVLVREDGEAEEWAVGTVAAIEDTKAVIDACANPSFRVLMEDGAEQSGVPYTRVLFDDSTTATDVVSVAIGSPVLARLPGQPNLAAGSVAAANREAVCVSVEATGRTVCVRPSDVALVQMGEPVHAGIARVPPPDVHPGAVPMNEPDVEAGDVVWVAFSGNSWYRAVVVGVDYDGVGPWCDAECSLRYLEDGYQETQHRSALMTAPPWEWLATDLDVGDLVAVCVLESEQASHWRAGTVVGAAGEHRYIVQVHEDGEVQTFTVPRHCVCELHDIECPDVLHRPVRVGDVVRVRSAGGANQWQPALLTAVTTTDDAASEHSEASGRSDGYEEAEAEEEEVEVEDYDPSTCQFAGTVAIVTFADGVTASVSPEELWWDPALTLPIFVALQSEHAKPKPEPKQEKHPKRIAMPAAAEIEMEMD